MSPKNFHFTAQILCLLCFWNLHSFIEYAYYL